MKIAVIGAGKLGTTIIKALSPGNHDITIIDKNEDVLNKLSSQFDILSICGNGKDLELLKDSNISSCDFVISCTDTDEKNIVISSFAKKLGCGYVIARVRDPEYMNQMEKVKDIFNIDYIVNPDLAITNEIYKYLVEKYTLTNGIFSADSISMIQFNVTRFDKIIGMSMVDVSREFQNALVAAISRKGKVIIPHGKDVVEKDDTLFLVGEKEFMSQIYSRVYEYGRYTNLQKVMIMGGGKTGFYLADKLSKFGVNVKLVEISKERCYYLSSHLDNVMVLHGDATDTSLLQDENIEEMDAFVAATGFDEENLLLSLIAKQNGIEDVISKISRKSYKDLVESMGVDMALNPLDIVTSNILGFIKGSGNVINSLLIQGQAEFMEVVASDKMKIVNHKLKDIKIPEGILLCAIMRDNEVIIPRGDTMIKNGDKITILYLLSDIAEVELFFSVKRFLH